MVVRRMVWSLPFVIPGSVYRMRISDSLADEQWESFIVESCVAAPRTTGSDGVLVFEGDTPRWDGGWHVHLRDLEDGERAVVDVMET